MTLGQPFSVVFTRAFGKIIVHIHGGLGADKAQELHDRLLDVIDGQGNRHLIIDLRAMTYIDAAGIAVLVDALKRMEQYGGDLVLSGPTVDVMHALDAAGLAQVFVVTPAWAHPAHGEGAPAVANPGLGAAPDKPSAGHSAMRLSSVGLYRNGPGRT